MQSVKYINKKGAERFKPVMNEEEYIQANEECAGFCIQCGSEADGVEPDARMYECEGCGAAAVYGLEELLIAGLLTFGE